MIPFTGLALLVCSMSVAGCGQGREPSPAAAATDSASAVIRYADLPTRLCLYVDRNRLEEIRQGHVRLWLQLRNRSASMRYSPAFTLSALDADGASAWQETFAMHIDQIEPATGEAQPQRFMFRLSEASIQTDAADVCFKLDRADAAAAVEQPSALEIELRWQEVAPAGEVPS
ncbi:MAG: hypothetical protein H0T88_11715 [Lysobacter sp.]|nr:hypothetical protein [Lysobacter sp.]